MSKIKFRKGDEVVVFAESQQFGRPYIRLRGVIIKKIHPAEFKVMRTHTMLGDHWQEVVRKHDHDRLKVLAHPTDMAPLASWETELKDRQRSWETANPEMAAAWKLEEARRERQSREIRRTLNRLIFGA
jgi:hypothetical protein